MRAYIERCQLTPGIAAHHALMIRELEAVESGECERLMLLMPPGSAKSTYASIIFAGWYMGRNPERAIIAASHTAELAERFGRRVRNQVSGIDYKSIFGFGLSPDSQAAGRWDNDRGGEYYACGVGGSVTGRRADLAIIDDPVKSREDADSERVRESTWQWYINDLLTRLKPGARQILVMTRWHEDDLGGRLLEREADKWRIVRLPMLAEDHDPLGRAPGERLWAEWFTEDMIDQARRDPRSWNALYQQNPVPDSGDYFKRDWFRFYSERPKHLHVYAASDYAVTDSGGDYTEHGVFGLDPDDNLYVLDWWSGQTASDVWIETQLDMMVEQKPLMWITEAGVIKRSIEPFLLKRMRERKVYCRLEWLPSTGDKPTMARGFQARAAMGKVYLPSGKQWADDLLSQLVRFPAGKYDDKVDVCGLIGRALDQTWAAHVPMIGLAKPRDRWDKAFNKDEAEDSWKTA